MPNLDPANLPPKQPDPTGGLINSPNVSASGNPRSRSIKDAAQARDVVNTIISANQNRQKINGRIMAKYNAEKPYQQAQLEAEGLGWRSNFTTKPLPAMIDRVAPRFVEAINGAKYLTNSALPSHYENSTVKTEAFRKGVTDTVRARKGWRNLCEDIAQENALFGYTTAAWLDEFGWLPTHFKQDEFYVSSGTKQLAATAQLAVLKATMLPHELFASIEDKEAATAVGWNVPNVIQAVNLASPNQLRATIGAGASSDAWHQHLVRELNVGSSYMDGASVIQVYHLLVREVTGKVSHYQLAGTDLTEIFSMEDRFDSMDDCLAFFAFQKGNSTMHGSKGIGRDIYELAAMIDRSRNEVVDRLTLSGKLLLQGDPKKLSKFKMSVVGAMVIIPDGWNVVQQTALNSNVEDFVKLDQFFSIIVDQLVGSTSPRFLEGERVTAAQVNLFASREEEAKDSRISRFLDFFVDMMGTIQRRLSSTDATDDDAKEFQKNMLKVMSREELTAISKQPVAGTVEDLSPMERQLIVNLAAEKGGNPLYNQRALEEEGLVARIDADFAKRVLLPENDPTVTAEQGRQQQLELLALSTGQQVPVSPRDNHEIHFSVLLPAIEEMAPSLQQGQMPIPIFEVLIAHVAEHLSYAEQAKANPEMIATVKTFLQKANQAISKLTEMEAAAAEADAAAAEIANDEAAQLRIEAAAAEGNLEPGASLAPAMV